MTYLHNKRKTKSLCFACVFAIVVGINLFSSIPLEAKKVTIAGKVLRQDGSAASGIIVKAFPASMQPMVYFGKDSYRIPDEDRATTAITNVNGHYWLQRQFQKPHAVYVKALPDTSLNLASADEHFLSLAEDEVFEQIDFRLESSQDFEVRVLDSQGNGIADIPVSLSVSGMVQAPFHSESGHSDSSGRFVIKGILPADYLSVNITSNETMEYFPVHFSWKRLTDSPLEVNLYKKQPVQLRAINAVTGASVKVYRLWFYSKAVNSGYITVSPDAFSTPRDFNGWTIHSIDQSIQDEGLLVEEEDGLMVIPYLGRGPWVLEAHAADGSEAKVIEHLKIEDDTSTYTLTLSFQSASSQRDEALTGIVLHNDLDRSPIEGALVYLKTPRGWNPGHGEAVRTKKDGSFRFTGLAGWRHYELIAYTPGAISSQPTRVQWDARSGFEKTELLLDRSSLVTGQVLGANDIPLAGAEVSIKFENHKISEHRNPTPILLKGVTDLEGRFKFDPIPSGPFYLTARCDDLYFWSTYNVNPGQSLVINLKQSDLALCSGHLLYNGKPFYRSWMAIPRLIQPIPWTLTQSQQYSDHSGGYSKFLHPGPAAMRGPGIFASGYSRPFNVPNYPRIEDFDLMIRTGKLRISINYIGDISELDYEWIYLTPLDIFELPKNFNREYYQGKIGLLERAGDFDVHCNEYEIQYRSGDEKFISEVEQIVIIEGELTEVELNISSVDDL